MEFLIMVNGYKKINDLFSMTSESQSDVSSMEINELDFIPCQKINLRTLQKYKTKLNFSSNTVVKLLLIVVSLLPIIVLDRYVLNIEKQDDRIQFNAKDASLRSIYTELKQLRVELKMLKIKCDKKDRIPLSNILNNFDERIEKALLLYDADKIGLIDYAMELSGGSVTSTPDTNPVYRGFANILELFNTQSTSNPNILIQPGSLPGQCFAFKGHTGRIRFQLINIVNITAVTLEHTNKNLVIDTRSAPKDFRVYGLDNAKSNALHDLGLYQYKLEGKPLQTFNIKKVGIGYKHVELQILSNYGNPEYTCVYRFRVHGIKI